jgi:hypothetical protein
MTDEKTTEEKGEEIASILRSAQTPFILILDGADGISVRIEGMPKISAIGKLEISKISICKDLLE